MHPASAPNAAVRPTINSIFDFSAEALGQLKTWLEQNPPSIPITQIIGFSGFTAQNATQVDTGETTTSTTFTDLATVGPTLSGLPDGKYLIFFGCLAAAGAAGQLAEMSVSVNGAAAATADQIASAAVTSSSIAGWVTKTLANGGNNTLQLKYKHTVNTSAATFSSRKLTAFKYANS